MVKWNKGWRDSRVWTGGGIPRLIVKRRTVKYSVGREKQILESRLVVERDAHRDTDTHRRAHTMFRDCEI